MSVQDLTYIVSSAAPGLSLDAIKYAIEHHKLNSNAMRLEHANFKKLMDKRILDKKEFDDIVYTAILHSVTKEKRIEHLMKLLYLLELEQTKLLQTAPKETEDPNATGTKFKEAGLYDIQNEYSIVLLLTLLTELLTELSAQIALLEQEIQRLDTEIKLTESKLVSDLDTELARVVGMQHEDIVYDDGFIRGVRPLFLDTLSEDNEDHIQTRFIDLLKTWVKEQKSEISHPMIDSQVNWANRTILNPMLTVMREGKKQIRTLHNKIQSNQLLCETMQTIYDEGNAACAKVERNVDELEKIIAKTKDYIPNLTNFRETNNNKASNLIQCSLLRNKVEIVERNRPDKKPNPQSR